MLEEFRGEYLTKYKIEEKTLEINICSNFLERIRLINPSFAKAYWRGLTLRLERHVGLDAVLETGSPDYFIILGVQFKRAINKNYDVRYGENYYIFEINNNPANDQHIILWIISHLLHETFPRKIMLIGYSFPMFIDHPEFAQYSPNFLQKTIFIDAMYFPINKLDRLSHEVYIYEQSHRVLVRSDNEVEIIKTNVLTGEDLVHKFKEISKKQMILISEFRRIRSENLSQLVTRLEQEWNISKDTIEYIKQKIDKKWQIKLSFLLIPP